MHLAGIVFVDVLVTLFFVGMAGSVVVILISFVEDSRELFGSDEPDFKTAIPPPISSAIMKK